MLHYNRRKGYLMVEGQLYRKEKGTYEFLMNTHWVPEYLTDFYYSFKEEENTLEEQQKN
jgi:hypothetical protein